MRRQKPDYSNGDVSLGRRGNEAVAEYRDAEGARRRVRLGATYRDLETAKAALDRFAERRRVMQHASASHTIGDLWRLWLADRAKDRLRNGIYQSNWKALEPAFASRYPRTITPDDCREYARGRFQLGRSSWTVHTELVRLRACLRWAADRDHIAKAPKIWVPQPGRGRTRVLTPGEIASIVTSAARWSDPHVHLFTVLLFSTGARHRAILDLTWDRIDWTAGTISFDEDVQPDPMAKAWRKGRATVPMTNMARRALEAAFPGRQGEHVIEHGGKRLGECREGFRAAIKRAGLWDPGDRITPHVVRHTVATMLDAAGVDVKRTAQLLGHADARTTSAIYTHASPEVLREAVAVLDVLATLPNQDRLE